MVDLHNHTFRCNHADGTPEEYLQTALRQGIKIFGFSDHAPMDFDSGYRMDFSEMEEYEREIRQLAEKYRDKITLLLGYEVDFTPSSNFNYQILSRPVDYLIGSVHFLDRWGFDNPQFLKEWNSRRIDEVYQEYFYHLLRLVRSGYFQIVAHLDLIKIFGYRPSDWDKFGIKRYVEPVLIEIKRQGMVVELNSAGWRKPIGEPYPSYKIIKEMARLKIPITFGSDAHKPEQVGYRLMELKKIAYQVGYREVAYFKAKKIYFYPL